MTLAELKKSTAQEIKKWCNDLPKDGDYRVPELITDRWNEHGDGDYALIMIFHNNNEAEKGGAE